MNKVDWSNYKFHCSGLKNLMVNPRLKSEALSETTKGYLRDIYIEEVYGRKKTDMVANKFVRKGVMCETDGLELVEKVKEEKFFKNQKTLQDDYLTGIPDVIADRIIDIKISWDLWTFLRVDQDMAWKDYYYQLLGYMLLAKKKHAELMYCLVNTPDEIIADEMHWLQFYFPEEQALEYRNNYEFDDIPIESRVKSYGFEFDKEEVEKLKERIELAKVYLINLKI